ncbi:hypothetical protein [Olivibacter domesticus]|uniref:Uncharacterized protein n=1 Tax=Olivibacter domesticus TaxID=407022 RepID=A0A1H7WVM9_OLID1|nr:hypothetical protein [Olivibacter domesticus]SEM24939.1 hypothetical protein SAMN05661044_04676 [Olivibacter domesticus]
MVFEIGGKTKNQKQLQGVKKGYVIKDVSNQDFEHHPPLVAGNDLLALSGAGK